jgi:cytochrome c oxidase assembly protein subunit 15
LPSAALGAVALVALQGVLGGLTVTQFLKFEIVTAHLGTGLAFFCYLLTIALILLNPTPAYGWSRGAIVGGCAVALVYGQCLLGGLVASQWAVHQCLDSQELCSVITTHLLGIVPASLGAVLVAIVGWHRLRKVSYGVLGLWLLQLLIGYSTYKLQLSVPALTVLHEAIGALLLASLVTFTALSARRVA